MRIVLEIGYDLNNFTEVWSFNGAVGLNFQAEITFPVNGRFVKFWLDATEYLSACEIEVYGEDGNVILLNRHIFKFLVPFSNVIFCPFIMDTA